MKSEPILEQLKAIAPSVAFSVSRDAKGIVIARWYGSRTTTCYELLTHGGARYIIATDGRVNDARQWMWADEARAYYDQAAYQIGARP